MTKSLLVICGTGVATSTVATGKIKSYLKGEGLIGSVRLIQSKVADEVNNIANGDYDIVVSTTLVPSTIKERVINGVPLLTGIGVDKVFTQVKDAVLAD